MTRFNSAVLLFISHQCGTSAQNFNARYKVKDNAVSIGDNLVSLHSINDDSMVPSMSPSEAPFILNYDLINGESKQYNWMGCNDDGKGAEFEVADMDQNPTVKYHYDVLIKSNSNVTNIGGVTLCSLNKFMLRNRETADLEKYWLFSPLFDPRVEYVASNAPSVVASDAPSVVASNGPSVVASNGPSVVASDVPSAEPSYEPSVVSTASFTDSPTIESTDSPTIESTDSPTIEACPAGFGQVNKRARECYTRMFPNRKGGPELCCPGLVCHNHQWWRCVEAKYQSCSGPGTFAKECGSQWPHASDKCCTGLGLVCKNRKCVLPS